MPPPRPGRQGGRDGRKASVDAGSWGPCAAGNSGAGLLRAPAAGWKGGGQHGVGLCRPAAAQRRLPCDRREPGGEFLQRPGGGGAGRAGPGVAAAGAVGVYIGNPE